MDGIAFGEEVVGLVRGFVERELAPLKTENEELRARIKALEDRPMPEVIKGDPGEPGKDGADGKDGSDGKDAAGFVDAVKDNGELVVTLQDGRLLRTGIRDGEKGADGKDGRDGFGLDDFDMEKGDDGRTFVLKFERGDTRHEYELTFPFPVYRSVFKDGTTYQPGDIVTWGGNAWHCDKETTGKPDSGDWTLMVKRGRDGKNANG